jgi:transcriptional regulator with XRE-family HTH domain
MGAMKIGRKVSETLRDRRRTQRWLADAVCVSPAAISKIVAGGSTSYLIAGRIAAALQVPLTWLYNDHRSGPPPPIDDLGSVPDEALFQEIIRRKQLVRLALVDIRVCYDRFAQEIGLRGRGKARARQRLAAARQLTQALRTHESTLKTWDEFWTLWDEVPVTGQEFPDLHDVAELLGRLLPLQSANPLYEELEDQLGVWCTMGFAAKRRATSSRRPSRPAQGEERRASRRPIRHSASRTSNRRKS